MILKINCRYNNDDAWCTNEKVKRSFWGAGPRCCLVYNNKKCEFNDCKTKRPTMTEMDCKTKRPTMTEFEYKIEKGYGIPLKVESLDTLGSQGWELCGIITEKNKGYINSIIYLYHLKRKKQK